MTNKIDYNGVRTHNFRTEVESALREFLSESSIDGFILYPQALNPFLKAIEAMGCWKKVAVFPIVVDDAKGKPAYMIQRISDNCMVESFETQIQE